MRPFKQGSACSSILTLFYMGGGCDTPPFGDLLFVSVVKLQCLGVEKSRENTVGASFGFSQYLYSYWVKNTQRFHCGYVLHVTGHLK